MARSLRPDVCLLDIRMPDVDGIEATRQLAGPDVVDPLAVVVITTFDLDEYVYGALKAGARGFLLKDAGAELLAQAVHAAARGDALIAPNITATAPVRLRRQPLAPGATRARRAADRREEQVLLAAARGRTNSEIGDELSISLSTVKTHIAALMRKLQRPQPRRDRHVGLRDAPRRLNRPGFHAVFRCEDSPGGGSGWSRRPFFLDHLLDHHLDHHCTLFRSVPPRFPSFRMPIDLRK